MLTFSVYCGFFFAMCGFLSGAVYGGVSRKPAQNQIDYAWKSQLRLFSQVFAYGVLGFCLGFLGGLCWLPVTIIAYAVTIISYVVCLPSDTKKT